MSGQIPTGAVDDILRGVLLFNIFIPTALVSHDKHPGVETAVPTNIAPVNILEIVTYVKVRRFRSQLHGHGESVRVFELLPA